MGIFKEHEIELEDIALNALQNDFSFEKDEYSLELPGLDVEAVTAKTEPKNIELFYF